MGSRTVEKEKLIKCTVMHRLFLWANRFTLPMGPSGIHIYYTYFRIVPLTLVPQCLRVATRNVKSLLPSTGEGLQVPEMGRSRGNGKELEDLPQIGF